MHVGGCEQLLGYLNGREFRGFVLEFFNVPVMYTKFIESQKHFDDNYPAEQSRPSQLHFIVGAFVKSHAHSSGREVMILHLGCNLLS